MLSDEEKEALRNFKSEYETCDHYSSDLIIELDDAEIILNLIEKQSKEIEELKEIYQKGYVNGCVSKVYEINKKWKDKIKAKIEEIDKILERNLLVDRLRDYFEAQKEVLQSLLEKE